MVYTIALLAVAAIAIGVTGLPLSDNQHATRSLHNGKLGQAMQRAYVVNQITRANLGIADGGLYDHHRSKRDLKERGNWDKIKLEAKHLKEKAERFGSKTGHIIIDAVEATNPVLQALNTGLEVAGKVHGMGKGKRDLDERDVKKILRTLKATADNVAGTASALTKAGMYALERYKRIHSNAPRDLAGHDFSQITERSGGRGIQNVASALHPNYQSISRRSPFPRSSLSPGRRSLDLDLEERGFAQFAGSVKAKVKGGARKVADKLKKGSSRVVGVVGKYGPKFVEVAGPALQLASLALREEDELAVRSLEDLLN